jgi:SAM-dependent methyltransferase
VALLKIWRTIRQQGFRNACKKVMAVAPAYLGAISHWQARRCQCCERFTIFLVQHNGSAETRSCLFCSANERYELLAAEIRSRYGNKLHEMDILELDPHSPLRTILSQAHCYTRSFYEEGCAGAERDGALCEDIAALSFGEKVFDLIVSSEVLEHVPRLEKAFSESARVLRPGGAHLFTVPPRAKTRKRAEVVDGQIRHIEPPDYHLDPLSPQGILAFWDIGSDLPAVIPCSGLRFRIVRGPVGEVGRVVWIAERAN